MRALLLASVAVIASGMNEPTSPLESGHWFACCTIALVVALFAVRNLPWHLDDYDQAKQAFRAGSHF